MVDCGSSGSKIDPKRDDLRLYESLLRACSFCWELWVRKCVKLVEIGRRGLKLIFFSFVEVD